MSLYIQLQFYGCFCLTGICRSIRVDFPNLSAVNKHRFHGLGGGNARPPSVTIFMKNAFFL